MIATIISERKKHYPVLLSEVTSIISPQYGGTFIDCTFGQGGYSKEILKFEEEAKTETESHEASTTNTSEEVVSSAIVEEEINSAEDGVSNVSEQPIETQETESSPSNGLENFNFDEETPELFNSDGETEDQTSLTSEISETKEEEDDLEIPAFLRRQKN